MVVLTKDKYIKDGVEHECNYLIIQLKNSASKLSMLNDGVAKIDKENLTAYVKIEIVKGSITFDSVRKREKYVKYDEENKCAILEKNVNNHDKFNLYLYCADVEEGTQVKMYYTNGYITPAFGLIPETDEDMTEVCIPFELYLLETKFQTSRLARALDDIKMCAISSMSVNKHLVEKVVNNKYQDIAFYDSDEVKERIKTMLANIISMIG